MEPFKPFTKPRSTKLPDIISSFIEQVDQVTDESLEAMINGFDALKMYANVVDAETMKMIEKLKLFLNTTNFKSVTNLNLIQQLENLVSNAVSDYLPPRSGASYFSASVNAGFLNLTSLQSVMPCVALVSPSHLQLLQFGDYHIQIKYVTVTSDHVDLKINDTVILPAYEASTQTTTQSFQVETQWFYNSARSEVASLPQDILSFDCETLVPESIIVKIEKL